MKRIITLGLILISIFALAGCASQQNYRPSSDYSVENWMPSVQTNPSAWTRGADHWFMTGDPNATEVANREAPRSAAMTNVTVNVPDCAHTTLKVMGDFQVQIYGAEHNGVYILGPNAGVRGVAVDVRGNTIFVRQQQNIPPGVMRRVIVRIGIQDLAKLVQMGCGTVEGIQIRGSNLSVMSVGSGNVYLSGAMNLRRVVHNGAGCINIFGAQTRDLVVTAGNAGVVNISGNLGVRNIVHHGNANINIIGANTSALKIYADGTGKVGVNGRMNVCDIQAKQNAAVYAYSVDSGTTNVVMDDDAKVGLAGYANTLNLEGYKSSHFFGRNLCVGEAFVRMHDMATANITVNRKAFITANDYSIVYFFGPSTLLSAFPHGHAQIMPFEERNWCNYNAEYRPYTYTYSRRDSLTYAGKRRMNYKGE